MKSIRTIVGFALILLALIGFLYWETAGREAVLMETVLVAKEQIKEGTTVRPSLFTEQRILPENRVEGAFTPDQIPMFKGQVVVQTVPKGAQISTAYLQNPQDVIPKGASIFRIDAEWIAMRSSSLRKDDSVELYAKESGAYLGMFPIAFVKDANDVEIKDNEGNAKSILKRTDANAMVDHIEIICSLADYQRICALTQGMPAQTLLLVQGGDLQ